MIPTLWSSIKKLLGCGSSSARKRSGSHTCTCMSYREHSFVIPSGINSACCRVNMAESIAMPGIVEFVTTVTRDMPTCITFMRTRGLMYSTLSCQTCADDMQLTPRSSTSDTEVWHCVNCRLTRTVRQNSFFAVSNSGYS